MRQCAASASRQCAISCRVLSSNCANRHPTRTTSRPPGARTGVKCCTVKSTAILPTPGKAIWQALLTVPLRGKPVTRLIVTHHHPDHIGLAGWFQAQGVELLTTRTAWLYARMLTLDEQRLPSPEALLFYQRAGLDATPQGRRGKRHRGGDQLGLANVARCGQFTEGAGSLCHVVIPYGMK